VSGLLKRCNDITTQPVLPQHKFFGCPKMRCDAVPGANSLQFVRASVCAGEFIHQSLRVSTQACNV
jgi:hypothetical protein